MHPLSVRDLATITAARIHLADLPPLLGAGELVTRIHFSLDNLQPGSLFCTFQPDNTSAGLQPELSFMQGAAGLLLDDRHVEPWAGRYTLRVSNTHLALRHLAAYLRDQRRFPVIAITPRPNGDRTRHYLETILAPSVSRLHWHPTDFLLADTDSHAIIELTEPITAHASASLLLAGPHILLTGHDDPFLTLHQERHVIHQILESLLPDGTLVFAECLNTCSPPPQKACQALPRNWAEAIDDTDIDVFRIGPSDVADLRITTTHGRADETYLEFDAFSLAVTPGTIGEAVARLTAYAVGRLLGQPPVTLARRLGIQDRPPFRRTAA
jgi:hypothetical protein